MSSDGPLSISGVLAGLKIALELLDCSWPLIRFGIAPQP